MAKYWFRQKTIGIGSTPNTWQGWLVTLGAVVLMIAVVLEAKDIADPRAQKLVALTGVGAIFIALSVICWLKTEGGWRWRSGRDGD
ncbi:MAG TPA: hypothetical protein VG798_06470 [Rhizomicrobium sp.]|nr:hypothetical protein [Rhizomicrobium sp.]